MRERFRVSNVLARSVTLGLSMFSAMGWAQNFVVSQYFLNDTQVFSPTGTRLCLFGTTTATERFYSIAFNSKGEMFVAGSRSDNIRKFSPTGKDLGDFAKTTFAAESLAVDSAGNVYVGGDGAFVDKYAPDGTYLGHFITTTYGDGNNVIIGPDGMFYLSNFDSGVVRRFTPEGVDQGVVASGLSAGQGTAINSSGELFVAERGQYGNHLHRIHKFDSSGMDLGTFGADILSDPLMMVMGPNDVLYVADYGSTAIRIFSSSGTYLGDFAKNLSAPSSVVIQPVAFENVAPGSVTLNLGKVGSGSLASLAADDGNPLNLCKAFVPNQLSPFVRYVVAGQTSLIGPKSLTFRVRSRMVHAGSYQQTLRLYNFAAASYDESRTDPLTLGIQYFDLMATGEISRYFGSGGILQSQIEIKQIGFAATSVPCASFEFVNWNVSQ